MQVNSLFHILIFHLIHSFFFEISSATLTTVVKETPDSPALGVTLLVSSIELEGRIAQNQLVVTIDDILESNQTTLVTNQTLTFSTKVDKSMTSLPAALYVGTNSIKDCIAYGWDTGTTVNFYQYCEEGAEWEQIIHLVIGFNGIDYEGCNNCRDTTPDCNGRPCSNCEYNCQDSFMIVDSWIETWNYSSNGRNLRQQNLHLKRLAQVMRADAEELKMLHREVDEDGHTSTYTKGQIFQDCQSMGTGPGRYLDIFIPSGGYILVFSFTPSSQTTSNPPQSMSLSCYIWANEYMNNEIQATKVQDYLNQGVSLSAVVLPFVGYKSIVDRTFYIYCDLRDSTDPAQPGESWGVRLWVNNNQSPDSCISVGVVLPGMETCPDNGDVDVRKLDDTTWEVAIVAAFGATQKIEIFTVLIDTDFCTGQVFQPYRSDLSAETKSIMLEGDVINFGDFLNIYFPPDEESNQLTLLAKVKNTESCWISVLTWPDWKASGLSETDLGTASIPYAYITSFPNNNIRVTQKTPQDIEAHSFDGGIWLAWQDEVSAIESTTIYGCGPGQQYIVDPQPLSENGTLDPIRGCFPCPPGQFKNSSRIGENCQLCPTKTYSNMSGATSDSMCKPCTGSDYCPSGMNALTQAEAFGQTTYSCTNPWFDATDEVDLEGGFYINQGILIFILSMITAALCLVVLFGHPQGPVWVSSFGVWMWEMDETEEEGKKKLFGIAGFAGAVAYILLVIFILYVLIGANSFIATSVDVENAVKSNFPTQYDSLTTDPIYFSMTFFGVISSCDGRIFDLSSVGFFDPQSGFSLLPQTLYVGPKPGSSLTPDAKVTECQIVIGVNRSLSSLTPQLALSFEPGSSDSYINRVEIEASTGIQDDLQLKSCTQDQTVTNKDDLNRICDESGYSYASILLTASQNRALRGSADVTIVKTLGVVENCKNSYNTYPWSFVQTKTNCEWCNSSTTLLFPSVVKSSLLESTFYYERDPSLNFTITLTEGNFARTASISRYFSIGSALLTILITGGGVLDLFALFLALGNYFYIWTIVPFLGEPKA